MQKNIKLRRPNHTTVIAYLSLFLVISGGAAYAATKIGSKQLKKNSVTAAKIKNNAVTAAKIRNDAVNTAKLQNQAVTQAKIADDAVNTAKLQNQAVTQAKIADNAVGGAQADEASFSGLIKGNGIQTSHTFTAPAVGFLPTPLVLADVPGFGQIRFLYCGTYANNGQMRVQLLSADDSQTFVGVGEVEASNLPAGTGQAEFVDFGGGFFAGGGGDVLIGQLPAGAPGPFGIVAKWDYQLYRGSDPNATTAHVSVSGLNDSTSTTPDGQCYITAETIVQP